MKKRERFKYQFLISISLLIITSMFFVYNIQKNILYSMVKSEIEKNLAKTVLFIDEAISVKKEDLLNKGLVLGEDNNLKEALSKNRIYDVKVILSQYSSRFQDINIQLLNEKGELSAESFNIPKELLLDNKTQKLLTEKYLKETFIFSSVERLNGKLYTKCYITLRHSGKNIGILILNYNLTDNFFPSLKKLFEYEILIYLNNNKLVFSSSPSGKVSDSSSNIFSEKLFPADKLTIKVVYPLKDFLENQKISDMKIWYVNITILIIALIVLNAFASRIVEPINLLINAINRVKTGDLDYEVKYKTSNEIGNAIENFNSMIRQLKNNKEKEKHMYNLDKIASVGRLAASVAHEIKNPLSSISMIINLYRESFGIIEFQKRDFDVMSKEIKRINNIIEKLLDFSKQEKIEIREISLEKLIEEMVTLTQKSARENGTIISISTQSDIPFIKCDENLLKQAILNVIINSIEATKNGKITINIEHSELNIKVKIADTGQGMSEEVLAKSMEPFYTTKLKGTGIGLAIVKKILDIHKFAFTINSKTGEGTEISIIIDLDLNKNLVIENFTYEQEILERRD